MKATITSPSFQKILDEARRVARERIRKAGKHKCVPVPYGTIRRVTGRGGKPLKRPVVVMQFHECKICGKNMTKR